MQTYFFRKKRSFLNKYSGESALQLSKNKQTCMQEHTHTHKYTSLGRAKGWKIRWIHWAKTDRSFFCTLLDIFTLIARYSFSASSQLTRQELTKPRTLLEWIVDEQWTVSYFRGKNRNVSGKKEKWKRREVVEMSCGYRHWHYCCSSDPSISGRLCGSGNSEPEALTNSPKKENLQGSKKRGKYRKTSSIINTFSLLLWNFISALNFGSNMQLVNSF